MSVAAAILVLSTCTASLCTYCLAAVVGKEGGGRILSKPPIETTRTRHGGAVRLEFLSLKRPNVGKNTRIPLWLRNTCYGEVDRF